MLFFIIASLTLFAAMVYRHHSWKAKAWPQNAIKPALVQAHRGYWQTGARENSLHSFAAAVHEGYKMFELDVRLTSDHVPVVFHDAELGRFLDSSEGMRDARVDQLTLAELKKRVDVPTLEEVLLTPKRPRMVNIELKSHLVLDSTLEQKTAELIRKLGVEDQVLISSFNPVSIFKISSLLPEVPRALLATQERDKNNPIYLRNLWLAPYVRCHLLHLDYRFLTPPQVAKFVKRGIPVALWTVNEKEKAQDFLQAGALSVISDTLKSEDLIS